MKLFRLMGMMAMAAGALALVACGGGNNAPANTPPANTLAGGTSTNTDKPAGNGGGSGTTDADNAAKFDVAAERDALVGKAWDYLKKTYNTQSDPQDENKVGIPTGWGPKSMNIPYTAMVLSGIYGTKVWDADSSMVKESVQFLLETQETGGGWSYAPVDVMPAAKGVRAVYITGIVAGLFADLNNEGPWKGKLNTAIAHATDYLKQSQVGNAEGPAPDYDKNKAGYGGWAYSKEEIGEAVDKKGKPASNMSTSSFAVDALHKCGVARDDPMWDAALTFFKRNQNAGEVQDEAFEALYNGKKVKMAAKDSPDYGGSIYSEETSKAGVNENADGTVTLNSYGTMTYNLLRAYIFCGLEKDSLPVKLAWGWIQRNYTVERVPGYPKATDNEQGLYYYFMSMGKTLDALGVDTVEEPERGFKHNWREDLVKALKGRQKSDGLWVNSDNDRWQEDSPVLCTCYALIALRHTK
jgi:hypothetical protein